MKSTHRLRGLCLVLLCLVSLSATRAGAAPTASLSLSPAPIARGASLTICVQLENDQANSLQATTLYVPLPVGIDQWKAEVRIDGGNWMPYPANGLIALGAIAAHAELLVDILVPIEPASPATLIVTAELLNSSGILAQADGFVNVLPNTDAGPDLIVDLGAPILLDDSSASDGGGLILDYQWTDYGAGGSFNDDAALHPIYTPPASSGVFELTLTVIDADGGESKDSRRIRVNAIPSVDLGGDLEAQEGTRLPISTASISDDDGWIAHVVWSDGGSGGVFLPSDDTLNPVYQVPEIEGCDDGIVTLMLQATDDWGATAEDTLTLHVLNVNHTPTIDIPDDLEAAVGQRVDVLAIAEDSDGWIETQTWIQIDGPEIALHAQGDGQHAWFDVPHVEMSTQLRLLFSATDNCGASASRELEITIIPEPIEDELPPLDASLDVVLDILDERGLPLSPLDPLNVGDGLAIRVTVMNTGESAVYDLTVALNNGCVLAFSPSQLQPWSSATATCLWPVAAEDLVGGLEIIATCTGTDEMNRPVLASASFRFAPSNQENGGAIDLELLASVAVAGVDDTLVYTYRITNSGACDLVALALVDEQLGWIELPDTALRLGEDFEVQIPYAVRESDLPGPLTNRAIVSAFTQLGERVEADDHVTVELIVSAGGGGAHSDLQADRIVISEIAWAGMPGNSCDEWIELANIGTTAVDLAGWKVAWHDKTGIIPPASQWRFIALSGVIEPLDETYWQTAAIQFVPQEGGLWTVQDPRWLQPGVAAGFYLLERASDDVVANVAAGCTYGDGVNIYFDLPDVGATVYLIDPSGTVVDSANAQYASRLGWPAGNLLTGATMERVNLRQGDFDDNWQTSAGVLTYGEDSRHRGWIATAGKPNSIPLDQLLRYASSSMSIEPARGAWAVTIPGTTSADRASIQIATLGDGAAGGGGEFSSPECSTIRATTGLTVQLDLTSASPGIFFVWMTLQNGHTMVLPIEKLL